MHLDPTLGTPNTDHPDPISFYNSCSIFSNWIRIYNPNYQSLSIDAHEADVNAVCFVDETTHIVASGQGCQ